MNPSSVFPPNHADLCTYCGCTRLQHRNGRGMCHGGGSYPCDCVGFRITGLSRREQMLKLARQQCERIGHEWDGDQCMRCALKREVAK